MKKEQKNRNERKNEHVQEGHRTFYVSSMHAILISLSLSAYAGYNVAHIILFVCAEFLDVFCVRFFVLLHFVNFMNTQ